MLLKLTCYLIVLVFLAHGQSNTTNLDYTDQCARVADYQENEEDYCSNFNRTCKTIIDRKKVCQSMELSCFQEQKSGSCVLMDCKEYTPDLEIRKHQEQVDIHWPQKEFNFFQCNSRITSAQIYFDLPYHDPTKSAKSIMEKVKICCSIEYRRLEAKVGNVCRNITDPAKDDGCRFHFCSPEEMKQKVEENVEKHTVRLTGVSGKDIDVTELAVDAVFSAHIPQNITRAYCPNFHNRCMQTFERYFGNGNFKIKESTCIPDIDGKVPQTACILIRSSDVESSESSQNVEKFEGTTSLGETRDMTGLAIEYASRYSKDDGAYCKNFVEGCNLVMNLGNIIRHEYQRKEVTCNRCILVKSSATDGSQILEKYPQPNTKDQRKLRLTEETEHLVPMHYGNHVMKLSTTYPFNDQNKNLEYHCLDVQRDLQAKIENVCRDKKDTYSEWYARNNLTRMPCNFHRCTSQEELEENKTSDPEAFRHTSVSEKDIDMTALVTDLILTNDRTINAYQMPLNYCRVFRNICWNLLDRYFYNAMDYKVKENTCQPEKYEMSAYGGFLYDPAVTSKGACILIRDGDK